MKLFITALAALTLISCAEAPSYNPGESNYSSMMIADIASESAALTPAPWSKLTVKVIDAKTNKVTETKEFQRTNPASDAKFSVKYGDYRFELDYKDANNKPVYASCEADKKFVHRIGIPLYTPSINLCLSQTTPPGGSHNAEVILKPVLTTNGGGSQSGSGGSSNGNTTSFAKLQSDLASLKSLAPNTSPSLSSTFGEISQSLTSAKNHFDAAKQGGNAEFNIGFGCSSMGDAALLITTVDASVSSELHKKAEWRQAIDRLVKTTTQYGKDNGCK